VGTHSNGAALAAYRPLTPPGRYGGQGQGDGALEARVPPNIGGNPVGPASKAIRSSIVIHSIPMAGPGFTSHLGLKLASPGLVPRRRTGAMNEVRSEMVIRFRVFGTCPTTMSMVRVSMASSSASSMSFSFIRPQNTVDPMLVNWLAGDDIGFVSRKKHPPLHGHGATKCAVRRPLHKNEREEHGDQQDGAAHIDLLSG